MKKNLILCMSLFLMVSDCWAITFPCNIFATYYEDELEKISINYLKSWNLQTKYYSIQELYTALEPKFGESREGYKKRMISTKLLFQNNSTFENKITSVTNNMIFGLSRFQSVYDDFRLLKEKFSNAFFDANYLEPSIYAFGQENVKILSLLRITSVNYLDANENTFREHDSVYEMKWGESSEGYKKRTLDLAEDFISDGP